MDKTPGRPLYPLTEADGSVVGTILAHVMDASTVDMPPPVGRISDKNNIARKRTYAETVANYVTPRVAPQIAIATHV